MNQAARLRGLSRSTSNRNRADAKRSRLAERDAIIARAKPTETVIAYCLDCAMCSCPPIPHEWRFRQTPRSVPTLIVGRDKSAGTDRCLHCDTVWTLREYRSDPARIVSRVLRRAS